MQTKPEHQLLELEPIDMHAPVEVHVRLYGRVKDGSIGSATFQMPPGQVPNRADIMAMIRTQHAEHAEATPGGVVLLSKPDFVKYITERETGKALAMPGNQEFVEVNHDFPRDLLIHAVIGAGVTPHDPARAQRYEKAGLAHFTGNQHNEEWQWNTAALAAMDDKQLYALYLEVTRDE